MAVINRSTMASTSQSVPGGKGVLNPATADRQRQRQRQRGQAAAAAAAIVVFYLVLEGMGITCPILYLTGISCAGCGMSRAWLHLLSGDLAGAAAFHPLFWMPAAAGIVWMLRRQIPVKILKVLAFIGTALFVVVYLIRMVDPADTIVVCTPEKGALARFWKAVFAWAA